MVVKQSHQESIEHVDGTIACLSPNQVDVLFILFKEREKQENISGKSLNF